MNSGGSWAVEKNLTLFASIIIISTNLTGKSVLSTVFLSSLTAWNYATPHPSWTWTEKSDRESSGVGHKKREQRAATHATHVGNQRERLLNVLLAILKYKHSWPASHLRSFIFICSIGDRLLKWVVLSFSRVSLARKIGDRMGERRLGIPAAICVG